MKNQLYMLAVIDEPSNLPLWKIMEYSSNYDCVRKTYEAMSKDRLLLEWGLTKGIHVLRMNIGNAQMSEHFMNVDFSFDHLSGAHRASLYVPVYNTVLDFLKN